MPQTAPYGTWDSPITSDLIVSASIGLAAPTFDGDTVYWLEGRATEGGRSVLVRRTADGTVSDVTPAPYYVRTTVHEYGGGAYLVVAGTVYFCNFRDQRIYRQLPGGEPEPITPDNQLRYADMILDAPRNRLIAVCEEQFSDGREPENSLVAIPLDGVGERQFLARGHDFYSSPKLSPDGTKLAYLVWDHPSLPWDGTTLFVASMQTDGTLGENVKVAGDNANESIFQPGWSPDGTLYFTSDRTDWWNLYRWDGTATQAIHPMAAEFGEPQWVFGMSTWQFIDAKRLLTIYTSNGNWQMGVVDTVSGDLFPISLPYSSLDGVQVSREKAVCLAASPTKRSAVLLVDIPTGAVTVLKESSTVAIDEGYISVAEPIAFPTTNGDTAYAFYYPPRNQDYVAPAGELPPLRVLSHGGPTSATSSAFRLSMQYWTSRGFAVVDVNYRGSTGYGRAYRQKLNGGWGVVDVDDCIAAARYLVEQGRADGNRLTISGGSAGGYTTLCALTFHHNFKAGASYFGISDLVTLMDSHKFESRYNINLVGPWPEAKDTYIARSPIHFVEQIACPVILFQGLDDKVVPPEQSQKIAVALREKHLPVAYVEYVGESHGFRKAENIKGSLENELYFYGRVFGFTPAGNIQPVEIENLA